MFSRRICTRRRLKSAAWETDNPTSVAARSSDGVAVAAASDTECAVSAESDSTACSSDVTAVVVVASDLVDCAVCAASPSSFLASLSSFDGPAIARSKEEELMTTAEGLGAADDCESTTIHSFRAMFQPSGHEDA